MKRFMYFSVGVLCLAVAVLIGFHIGSKDAAAQAPQPIIGWQVFLTPQSEVRQYVMLANGDVYRHDHDGDFTRLPYFVGNFFAGNPVPNASSTLGTVKSKYR